MKNQLLNKRIPTLLGIVLILISIPLIALITKNEAIFKSTASDSQEPFNIKITNITDASFTVTYQTDVAVTGSISYGNNKQLGKSELEDTDKEKVSFSPKKIHSISVKDLTPSTKYYLSIISGSETFLDNGALFEVTTGPNLSSPSATQHIIKGKIVLPDGSVPSGALVYLNAENSQLLSSAVTKDGTFNFPLKDLRTDDLSSYFDVNENTIFKIMAISDTLKSTASVSLGQSESIPTITLSNDYDFTQGTFQIASKSKETQSGFPQTFPTLTAPSAAPIPTSTPIPTITPTLFPSPTVAVLIPTPTPFPPTAPVTIESKGGLPPTGDSSAIILTVGGIMSALAGLALFFFTHKVPL